MESLNHVADHSMAPKKLPRLSRIEFFRCREVELASALARAIADHVDRSPNAELTDQHAAIWAWSSAAINVPNGGFVQFFYNHRGDHGVHELAALLNTLDLSKAATILLDATAVYNQHRHKFEVSNPWDGLFGSIEEFEKLDTSFVNVLLRCGRALDSWIREHVAELAADESGAPINPKFTGTVEIRHPNGQIKELLEVKNGKPHGAYREYFEDGSVRNGVFYKAGKVSGDFWPSGQLKRKESKRGNNRIIEWFYPNGVIQKRYMKDKDGYAAEPIRLFHQNGQLAEELTTVKGKQRGPWLKFFDDGTPELQAEHTINEEVIVHNAWNAKHEQVVIDGTGIFRDYRTHIDWEYDVFFENDWPRESELKDGIPHGKVTTYHCGVLWSIAHYVHGERHGESTTYWDNGRIRSVTKFVKGKEGKSTDFPKFDDPTAAVVLSLEADEKLYAAWRHIAVDEYPRALNFEEVQKQLKVPQFLREVHERNLAGTLHDSYEDCNTFDDGIAYFLTVDVSGEVTAATANGSGVYSGGAWDTYPPFLRKLRFSPGRIGGRAIECRVLARVDHTFVERES
jgi:antitoxin component YwqK of YwqJK toxin-antitoxin module